MEASVAKTAQLSSRTTLQPSDTPQIDRVTLQALARIIHRGVGSKLALVA